MPKYFNNHHSHVAGIFTVVFSFSGTLTGMLPEKSSVSRHAGFSAKSVCISYSEPYLFLARISHASPCIVRLVCKINSRFLVCYFFHDFSDYLLNVGTGVFHLSAKFVLIQALDVERHRHGNLHILRIGKVLPIFRLTDEILGGGGSGKYRKRIGDLIFPTDFYSPSNQCLYLRQ